MKQQDSGKESVVPKDKPNNSDHNNSEKILAACL